MKNLSVRRGLVAILALGLMLFGPTARGQSCACNCCDYGGSSSQCNGFGVTLKGTAWSTDLTYILDSETPSAQINLNSKSQFTFTNSNSLYSWNDYYGDNIGSGDSRSCSWQQSNGDWYSNRDTDSNIWDGGAQTSSNEIFNCAKNYCGNYEFVWSYSDNQGQSSTTTAPAFRTGFVTNNGNAQYYSADSDPSGGGAFEKTATQNWELYVTIKTYDPFGVLLDTGTYTVTVIGICIDNQLTWDSELIEVDVFDNQDTAITLPTVTSTQTSTDCAPVYTTLEVCVTDTEYLGCVWTAYDHADTVAFLAKNGTYAFDFDVTNSELTVTPDITIVKAEHEAYIVPLRFTIDDPRSADALGTITQEVDFIFYDFCSKLRFETTHSFYAGNTPESPIITQRGDAISYSWTTIPVTDLDTDCTVEYEIVNMDGTAQTIFTETLGVQTDTAKDFDLDGTFDETIDFGLIGYKMIHRLYNNDDSWIVEEVETIIWFNVTNPCIEDDQWTSLTLTTVTETYDIGDTAFTDTQTGFQDEFSSEMQLLVTDPDPFSCGPVAFTLYLDDQITEIQPYMLNYANYNFFTLTPDANGRDYELEIESSDLAVATNSAVTYYVKIELTDWSADYPDNTVIWQQYDITMNNCLEGTLTPPSAPSDQTVTVFDDVSTDVSIAQFTQAGSCAYTVTYTAVWVTYYGTEIALPDWVTFTASTTAIDTNDFEMITSTITDVTTATQTYTFKLYGTISDTLQQTELVSSVEFNVEVTNPCVTTTSSLITAQVQTDLDYVIDHYPVVNTAAEITTITFTAFADAVSTDYTGTDLCGLKSYEIYHVDQVTPLILEQVPWMTNNIDRDTDTYEIDIYSSDYNDITDPDYVQFYLKVWLDDYYLDNPDGAIHWEPFRIKLESDNCLVSTLAAPAITDVAYDVYDAQHDEVISAFTQTTACGYTVTYTPYWRTYQDTLISLPSFIAWDLATMTFEIQTDDVSLVTDTYMTYTIELVGSIDDTIQYIPIESTASFAVTVSNPCLTGPAITSQGTIQTTVYDINDTAVTITFPYYTSAVEDDTGTAGACGPIETSFYLLDNNGVYSPMNFTEYPYLTYFDDTTNSEHDLTIYSTDVQDTTNAAFDIYVVSWLVDYYNEDPEEDFSIIYDTISLNMRNCDTTSLTPPTAPAAQAIDVFNHASTDVSIAQFTQAGGCSRTVTYTATWVNYYDQEILTLPDWVTFTAATTGGTTNDFVMITSDVFDVDTADHTYTIRLTGTIDNTIQTTEISAYVDFDVVITNPCVTTTSGLITSQTIADTDYVIDHYPVANAGSDTTTITFTAFADSVTTAYTGTDLCGLKSYEIYHVDQVTPLILEQVPWMTNNIDRDTSTYEIDIYSSDYSEITDPDYVQFYLKVWLDDYYLDNPEGAIHWESFRVKLESDNCIVATLAPPSLTDVAYDVYYPVEEVVVAAFTQTAACGYTVTYTAQWHTYQGSIRDLPPFITWDLATMTFDIVTTNIDYISDTYLTYDIELVGVIDDTLTYLPIENTATFTVTVSNPCLTAPAITDQTIAATSYTIAAAQETINIPYFISQVETDNPTQTGACGPIETDFYLMDANNDYYPLNFTEHPYLTYNDDTGNSRHQLLVSTSDRQHTTNAAFNIYARSVLTDYKYEDPDESFAYLYTPISLDLINCEATLTAPAPPSAQTLTIFDDVSTDVNIAQFTQGGSCAYTVTYTADWVNYYDHTVTSLPDWVTFTAATTGGTTNDFGMITNDIYDADTAQHTYKIRLTGTIDTDLQKTAVSATVEFDVVVTNPCVTTTSGLITDQPIADTDYVIDHYPVNNAASDTTTITFTAYDDSVTTAYTGTDLCGLKSYEIYHVDQVTPLILEQVTWMTNNIDRDTATYEIDIYSSDYNDLTDPDYVQFYLKVWLDDYYLVNPDGAIHWQSFRVMLESDNCVVTGFTAPAVPNLTYRIYFPQEDVTVSAFTQTPACGYTVTYTDQWNVYQNSIRDLPPFITWDLATMTFSISSDDVSHVTGLYTTYDIELQGDIGIDLTYVPVTTTATFTVTVENPCLDSPQIISQGLPISATEYWIGDAQDTITFDYYTTQTETDSGYVGACGPIETDFYLLDSENDEYYPLNFTLYPYLTYVDDPTNSEHNLQIHATDPFYTTNAVFTIYVRSVLVDYQYEYPDPSMAFLYDTITLNIRNCMVTSFTKPAAPADILYNVHTPVYWQSFAEYTPNSDAATLKSGDTECGYTMTFTRTWETYWGTQIELPDFITWNDADSRFEIYTDDPGWISDLMNTYVITVTATIDDTQQYPALEDSVSFNLQVNDGCLLDEMTVTQTDAETADGYIYYINENTEYPTHVYSSTGIPKLKQWNHEWSQTVPGCPIAYYLYRTETDVATGISTRSEYSATTDLLTITDYSATELFVFDIPWDDQNIAGDLDLFQATVDITVTDYVWDTTIVVATHSLTSIESTHANREGNVDFTITIKDVCWDLAIDDPFMTAAYLTANAGATTDLYLTVMDDYAFEFEDQNYLPSDWAKTYCGNWVHTLEYVSGPFTIDVDFTQSDFETSYTTDEAAFTITNNAKLDRTWIGTHTIRIKAANDYAGREVYSVDYTLELVDPCAVTVITCDPLTLMDTSIRAGTEVTQQLNNCGDTVSDALLADTGNTYFCGTRSYQLRLAGSNQINFPDTYSSIYPWMTFSRIVGPNDSMDDDQEALQFSVISDEHAETGDYNFELVVELDDFPEVAQEIVSFDVYLNPCVVTYFEAPSNITHVYTIGDNNQNIDFTYAQSPCSYDATYTYTYINQTDIVEWLETLQDNRESNFHIYTDNLTSEDFYEVWITATLDNLYNWEESDGVYDPLAVYARGFDPDYPPSDLIYQASFMINMTIELAPVNEYEVSNTRPYLSRTPGDMIFIAGEEFTYDFGEPIDQERNNVFVTFTNDPQAIDFITFDESDMTLTIDQGATSNSTAGTYHLSLYLVDDALDDFGGPQDIFYEWDVYVQKSYPVFSDEGTVVTADVSDGTIETIPEAEDLYGYGEDNSIDLDPVAELIGDSFSSDFTVEEVNQLLVEREVERLVETGEITAEEAASGSVVPEIVAVVPEITSISVTGSTKIDLPFSINVPEDWDTLFNSDVAFRQTSVDRTATKETLKTDTGFKDFVLRPAIEVKIESSEANPDSNTDLSWNISEFTSDYMLMDLDLADPENLSLDELQPNNLVVTFWGGFHLTDGTTQVLNGYSVKAPITRQIAKDTAESYRKLGNITAIVLISLLVVFGVLALITDSDLMAIFSLFETIQILSHFTLMSTSMPGRLVVFFEAFTQMTRFNYMANNLEAEQYWLDTFDGNNRSYNLVFGLASYKYTGFAQNMIQILIIYGVLLTLWFAGKLKDILRAGKDDKSKWLNLRYSPIVMNIAVRFTHMVFLEICICSFIQLQSYDWSSMNSQVVLTFASLLFASALMLLAIGLTVGTRLGLINPHLVYVHPQYRTLFHGLNKLHGSSAATYQLALLIRKVVFAAIVVFLHESTFTQVLVLQFTCLYVLSVLWSYNPIHDGDIRSFCFINEATIFLMSMALLAFTNLGPQVNIRDYIANYVLAMFFILLVSNLLVILHKVVFSLIAYMNKINFIKKNIIENQKMKIEVKFKPQKGVSKPTLHQFDAVTKQDRADASDVIGAIGTVAIGGGIYDDVKVHPEEKNADDIVLPSIVGESTIREKRSKFWDNINDEIKESDGESEEGGPVNQTNLIKDQDESIPYIAGGGDAPMVETRKGSVANSGRGALSLSSDAQEEEEEVEQSELSIELTTPKVAEPKSATKQKTPAHKKAFMASNASSFGAVSDQLQGINAEPGSAGVTYPPPANKEGTASEGGDSQQLDDSELSSEGDVAALFAQMRSKIANKELSDSNSEDEASEAVSYGPSGRRPQKSGHRYTDSADKFFAPSRSKTGKQTQLNDVDGDENPESQFDLL